ncbi:MAG: PAS domain-containing protein [Melioribacteraceae bacterium]|nr:PAS domain-containing protein [Melioribacteraceae bacterium]
MENSNSSNNPELFEQLKEKYDQLKSILDSSPFINYICKNQPNYPLVYISKNVEEIGINHDYFLENGLNLTDLIHEDDLENVIIELNEYLSFEAEEYMLMHRLSVDDEQVIWVDNYIRTKKDENGRISHFYGFLNDITTRNELAQNYLNELYKKNIILEAVQEQILCFDEEGYFLYYHAPTRDFIIEDPETCIGKHIFEIVHSTLAKEIVSNAMQAFKLNQEYAFILQFKQENIQNKIQVRIVPSTKNYFFVIMKNI